MSAIYSDLLTVYMTGLSDLDILSSLAIFHKAQDTGLSGVHEIDFL
jgi:hypothetical protein